ncbi:hypothetical protein WMY93_018223 [Mugilogobius chulae]|uniref:ribonuclease H n=1 Tax=Mugilogobius chulae TaxID=88201 RepID=A0AAW0NPS6_9GOBI
MTEAEADPSGFELGATVSMAANIPPPSPMSFTGDWSANWEVFRAEFEDYILVTGIAEKDKKIQAATLRSIMGSECRHVYRHNLNLTAEQQEDPAAIVSALERYFKPAKNIIYERYLFGCCKQDEGESVDAFVTRLREKASTCDTCERLGFMHFTLPDEAFKVDSMLPPGHLSKDRVISKYSEVFTSPVEALPGEVHFDLDPEVKPVQCAPRNVPIALKAAVKEQLDKYEAEGHITAVTEPTDWISNMVIVNRPQKLRICLDPKFLNKALRRSHYIMPTLEDVLYKLPKARIFTLVDARDAFLQCKLDTESSMMTTFWTHWGRKRWLKLPFGVSVAPEVYQRKQHELLAGLEGIEPIADDILVVGCGDNDVEAEADHDTKLLALLNPEKVQAILDMPNPTDAKAVQRLVGFANYLAKFMPHLSSVCEPLRRLLDKDTPWHWLPKHDAAMQELKTLATTMPVLRYYDVSKPVTIQSDASQSGLGCCLMQEGQPAQIEKECLSIVFACQRFHHYLYGRSVITEETDHKPLISIFGKPLLSAPKRIQSMLMTLQNYSLNVVYKPGQEVFISDTLSRATTVCAGKGKYYQKHSICSLQEVQDELQHVNQADHLNVTSQRLEQIS